MISSGGGAATWLLLESFETTPILGMSTTVSQPLAPVIFTMCLSYFMAQMFMDIFELAVLVFMFVREKNKTFGEIYGPDATAVKKLEADIEKQDFSAYGPSK